MECLSLRCLGAYGALGVWALSGCMTAGDTRSCVQEKHSDTFTGMSAVPEPSKGSGVARVTAWIASGIQRIRGEAHCFPQELTPGRSLVFCILQESRGEKVLVVKDVVLTPGRKRK